MFFGWDDKNVDDVELFVIVFVREMCGVMGEYMDYCSVQSIFLLRKAELSCACDSER